MTHIPGRGPRDVRHRSQGGIRDLNTYPITKKNSSVLIITCRACGSNKISSAGERWCCGECGSVDLILWQE